MCVYWESICSSWQYVSLFWPKSCGSYWKDIPWHVGLGKLVNLSFPPRETSPQSPGCCGESGDRACTAEASPKAAASTLKVATAGFLRSRLSSPLSWQNPSLVGHCSCPNLRGRPVLLSVSQIYPSFKLHIFLTYPLMNVIVYMEVNLENHQ